MVALVRRLGLAILLLGVMFDGRNAADESAGMTVAERKADTIALFGGGPVIAGKEIVSLVLARGLRDRGFCTVWITSHWEGKGDFVAILRAEKFEFYRLRLGFISISLSWKPIIWTLDQLRYWPALIFGYAKLMRQLRPRAVIHNNWHHAFLLAPALVQSRDVYWCHEIVPNNWRYRWVFRLISRRVGCVVCVSHAVYRSLEALGVDRNKLVVVHNGSEFEFSVPAPRSAAPLRLGIVGQIGPWKGHDDLVEAVAQLRDKTVPVLLKIFGKGSAGYVDSLKAKSRSLGVEHQIEWRGFVGSQALIFGEIDICVMPSRCEESFGMSALEASFAGRPVIATSAGGLPEIVKDAETGFLVEPGRPEKLADAIEVFARQPDLVLTMGHAACQRARSNFTSIRFVDEFVAAMNCVRDASAAGGPPRQ